MSALQFHWFLPTYGDSRYIVGGGHGLPAGVAGGARPATLDYLLQIARSAEQLGYVGALTPTGAWCEDAFIVDAMLAAGFLDEVRALRRRPGLHLELPSIRCVGYRQAWEALDVSDPPDIAPLRERGIAATRQLAKRQVTWLRGMAHRHVVEADAADVEARLLATATRLLGPPGSRPYG